MALTTFVAGNVLTAAQLNDSYEAVGGLRPVIPTSVTVTGAGSSASVSATGEITMSTAESVSINGAFTSAYNNYRVVWNVDSSNPSIEVDLRVRAAGTDNTSANYLWGRDGIVINSGGQADDSAGNALVTIMRLCPISGLYTSSVVFDVCMPQNASYNTVVLGQGIYVDTVATNAAAFNFFGITSVTTSYDGFTLIASSGNMTGLMKIYGYSK